MISVVCPAYEMQGHGVQMLRELLASLQSQSFRDFEIVVSDASATSEIVTMPFTFYWYDGKEGAAANLNNAIDHARRDIIKPMFQDDKFIEPDSLQKIADAFGYEKVGAVGEAAISRPMPAQWIACTSHNDGEFYDAWDHVPHAHRTLAKLREGENTYGSPSAMAWRKNDLRFDENLSWLFDCEFYARMAERYGVPTFVDTPIYVRQWEGMATKTVATGHQRIMDSNYVIEKYR